MAQTSSPRRRAGRSVRTLAIIRGYGVAQSEVAGVAFGFAAARSPGNFTGIDM